MGVDFQTWKRMAAEILAGLLGNRAAELLARELRNLTLENMYPWLRDLVIVYKNGLIFDEGSYAGGPCPVKSHGPRHIPFSQVGCCGLWDGSRAMASGECGPEAPLPGV